MSDKACAFYFTSEAPFSLLYNHARNPYEKQIQKPLNPCTTHLTTTHAQSFKDTPNLIKEPHTFQQSLQSM